MTPERWNQVKVLFQQAVELDETGREAFLGRACDNESLRREVELLISGHKRAGSFIESPPSDLAAKVMADQNSSPCSQGQPLDVLVLRKIGPHAIDRSRRSDAGVAEGKAADIPRSRKIALHQRRRDS